MPRAMTIVTAPVWVPIAVVGFLPLLAWRLAVQLFLPPMMWLAGGRLLRLLGSIASTAPDPGGARLRATYARRALGAVEKDVHIHRFVTFSGEKRIHIGSGTAINSYSMLVGMDDIHLGKDVLVGPHVVIHSGNHRFADPDRTVRSQGHSTAPIRIEDDVWIGAHAVILAGAHIEKGAVVAAGAVVRGTVAAGTIVGGVPAKLIGQRGIAAQGGDSS